MQNYIHIYYSESSATIANGRQKWEKEKNTGLLSGVAWSRPTIGNSSRPSNCTIEFKLKLLLFIQIDFCKIFRSFVTSNLAEHKLCGLKCEKDFGVVASTYLTDFNDKHGDAIKQNAVEKAVFDDYGQETWPESGNHFISGRLLPELVIVTLRFSPKYRKHNNIKQCKTHTFKREGAGGEIVVIFFN